METFMFHHWWCSTELWTLQRVLFLLYLSLNFYVHATISKFHRTIFIVNNFISWNNNKLVFYAWLILCGVRINYPFTFAHGMSYKGLVLMFDGKNQRQWGATCNIEWLSHCHVHAHWTMWKHWSLHDSWEKQYHWKFHPTFTWWFMDSVLLDLLFPSWYMN